jgi:uncharacterized integral membrane protein
MITIKKDDKEYKYSKTQWNLSCGLVFVAGTIVGIIICMLLSN